MSGEIDHGECIEELFDRIASMNADIADLKEEIKSLREKIERIGSVRKL